MEEGEDRAYSRAVAAAGAAAASRRMPQLGTIAELEPDPDCSAIYDGVNQFAQTYFIFLNTSFSIFLCFSKLCG